MAMLIYNGSSYVSGRPLMALMVLNAAFSLAVLFAWALVAVVVAEPISWATWAPLSEGSQPDLLDYPFVLLWALPVFGILVSWVCKNLHRPKLAYFTVMTPIVILTMVFSYFYLVPQQYH